MSYKCAHCGGRHNRPETAQKCANENRRGGYEGSPPDAFYLVTARETKTDELIDACVQLKTVHGGRWDGYRLMNIYNGDGKLVAVSNIESRKVLYSLIRSGTNRSGSNGFRKAMLRFGTETGRCPICVEEITDPKERADGVHKNPACYTNVFG